MNILPSSASTWTVRQLQEYAAAIPMVPRPEWEGLISVIEAKKRAEAHHDKRAWIERHVKERG